MSRHRNRPYPSRPGGNRGSAPAFNGEEAFKRAGNKPVHTVYSTCVHADRLCSLAKRVERFLSDLNYRCGRGFVDYTRLRKVQDELFTAIAVFQSTFEKSQNSLRGRNPNAVHARPQQAPAPKPQQNIPKGGRPAGNATPAAQVHRPGGNGATDPRPAQAAASKNAAVGGADAPAKPVTAGVKPAVEKPAGGETPAVDKSRSVAEVVGSLDKMVKQAEATAPAPASQPAGAKKPISRVSRIISTVRNGPSTS